MTMSNEKIDVVEIRILTAVRKLLEGRVNEIINDRKENLPVIEFGNYQSNKVVTPVITLDYCEKTEKERIIKNDVYAVDINFSFNDERKSEIYCYIFTSVIYKAINENKTLDGAVERVVFTKKKYIPPKHPKSGEGWSVNITLRITVEEMEV